MKVAALNLWHCGGGLPVLPAVAVGRQYLADVFASGAPFPGLADLADEYC